MKIKIELELKFGRIIWNNSKDNMEEILNRWI